jgi:hypothetical protein
MKRRIACWIAGFAALALLPRLACAQAEPAGADHASGAPAIEDLKQAALDLGVERLQRVEPPPSDGDGLLEVYVGPGSSDARLLSASLTIDDQPAIRLDFAPSESAALDRTDLYRLARLNLPPGNHRLHATLVLRFDQAGAPVDSTTLDLDRPIGLSAGIREIELQPDRETPLDAWHLRLDSLLRQAFGEGRAWFPHRLLAWILGKSKDRYVIAGSEDDPVVRYGRFRARNAEYLDAAVILEQLRQVPGMRLAPAYNLERCRVLVQYGLLDHARSAGCAALTEDKGVNFGAAWGMRLDLAEADLQRGTYAAADEALGVPPGSGEEATLSRWRDIKSRLLIAQGRLGEAAEFLRGNSAAADYASYLRYYNLAVARIANGSADQGLTILDRVGQLQATSPPLQALIDRANLALGAYFLRNRQGATAIPILERIGIEGIYANRALLDLGWAWLAPAGPVQERVEIGDERTVGAPPESVGQRSGRKDDQNLYQRYDLDPFTRVHADDDVTARRKRALAVWSQILGRDPEDEAVQETLLAVAYTLEQIGAHRESVGYLEKADNALGLSLSSLDNAVKYVEGDSFVNDLLEDSSQPNRFQRGLNRLPPPALAKYVYETLADARFQGLVADYRDLHVLSEELQSWTAATDSVNDKSAVPAFPGSEASAGAAGSVVNVPGCQIPCPDGFAASVAALRKQMILAQTLDLTSMRRQLKDDLDTQIHWRARLQETTRFTLARSYDAASWSAQP